MNMLVANPESLPEILRRLQAQPTEPVKVAKALVKAIQLPCHKCGGTGRYKDSLAPCWRCTGKGFQDGKNLNQNIRFDRRHDGLRWIMMIARFDDYGVYRTHPLRLAPFTEIFKLEDSETPDQPNVKMIQPNEVKLGDVILVAREKTGELLDVKVTAINKIQRQTTAA